MFDWADEIFAPLLDCAGFSIYPIQVRLDIAVGAGYISYVDAEENVAAVVGPVQFGFNGLVVG